MKHLFNRINSRCNEFEQQWLTFLLETIKITGVNNFVAGGGQSIYVNDLNSHDGTQGITNCLKG